MGYDVTSIRSYDVTSIRNYTQLQGAVKINSNSTIFPFNQFNVTALTLDNSVGTIDGLPIWGSILFQNVTIDGFLENGAVASVIESPVVYMVPTDYGRYSCLLLNDSSKISMQVPQKGVSFSILTNNNEIHKINLESGEVSVDNIANCSASNILDNILPNNVNLENTTSMLTYVPSVSVNGNVSFPKANVPNYIINVVGDSLSNSGNVHLHFNFDSSSDSVIVLTDFDYSGTLKPGQPPIDMIYWEITIIPWLSVLPFPLFLIITALLLIIFIRRRLKNRNY